jgi:hypothetical protein
MMNSHQKRKERRCEIPLLAEVIQDLKRLEKYRNYEVLRQGVKLALIELIKRDNNRQAEKSLQEVNERKGKK